MLPTPKSGETKTKFVERFMADKTALKEFPDQKQRSAVAYKQWEKAHPEDVKAADVVANMAACKVACQETGDLCREALAANSKGDSDLLRALATCVDKCEDCVEGIDVGSTYGCSMCAAACEICANLCDDVESLAACCKSCRATASLCRSMSAGTGPLGMWCADSGTTSGSNYQLNHTSLEKLKALIRNGKYVDDGDWTFSVEDSNELLGDPANWTDFSYWFLGIDNSADKESKAAYGYPFGKGGQVHLSALRAIAAVGTDNGAGAISDAAQKALDDAEAQIDDKAQARRKMEAKWKDSSQSLALTGKLEIKASAEGETSGPPTFSMVAYTGGQMRLAGWKFPVVVDVEGVEGHEKPRPIFRDHDQGQELGHTNAIDASNNKIVANGVMSGHGPQVDRVVKSAANGFPWQASIGAKALKTEFVPEGESAKANGRTFKGPVNIARRSALGEISIVGLGADDNTSARIAASSAEGSTMEFEKWIEAMGLVFADLSDEQKKKLKAKFDKEQADIAAAAGGDDDPENDADTKKLKAALTRAEKALIKAKSGGDKKVIKAAKAKVAECKGAIEAAGVDLEEEEDEDEDAVDPEQITKNAVQASRKMMLDERKRMGAVTAILDKYRTRVDAKKFGEIEAKSINEEWDADETELACLRIARSPESSQTVHASFGINVGADSDATPAILAAAGALAGGVSEKAALAGLNDQQKNIATSRKVRNSVGSIYGMCSAVAAMHGKRMPSTRMDSDVLATMQVIERIAAERDLDVRAEGGTGSSATMSLSGITENILNKAMLESYGTVDSIVPDIAYESDTNDFKQYKRYRMTAAGILSALGPAAELKSVSLQDESYPNQVKTQGVIMTIGRDIFINDDMGAITQAPNMLGRGAALYREMIVIGTYFSAKSTVAPGASTGQTANAFNFFSTGAANYMTSAGSALGVAGVTTAVQKFREQTDANNMPIMLKPDRLLVPPALETTADTLFNGSNLVVGQLAQVAATGGTKVAQSTAVQPDLNTHKGKYRPIVSPFLSSAVATKIAKLKGDAVLANFANASDTAWDLLTNPAGGMAIVQVGYLRGQRTPIIERGEAQFNTLGISMRLYYDFGSALHDYRCGVHSDGV